jgi:predicted secreted protein
MSGERTSSPAATLSRRTFLTMASSAAVGLLARPAWGSAVPAAEHTLMLRIPRATRNGTKVPIVVETAHPMTPDHRVTVIRVRNESDPISSKGTFRFTPANGRVYLAFQARMHDGLSEVTATAECSVHGPFTAASPIEIAAGAGGCVGGASLVPGRTRGDDVAGPVLRIQEQVERGAIRHGELVHVQVKMRHPNRTGLVLREGRFVPEAEPIHLDALEVFYGDEPVSHFTLTSALSDDPLITFGLLARRNGTLRVVVTNSRGQRFEAARELHVS